MDSTNKSKIKRLPKRGFYDKKTIYKILDANFICHIGFVFEDYPVVIPTIYARKDDIIYMHGASVSRMLVTLEKGVPISLTVTQVDGIVLARSAFHHSLNYQSVVVFGVAEEVIEESECLSALECITNQVVPNRWNEVRLPSVKELKATKILKIKINEASAKIRTGFPVDDKADYKLPIWAGVLPLKTIIEKPIPDLELSEAISIPTSVQAIINKKQ